MKKGIIRQTDQGFEVEAQLDEKAQELSTWFGTLVTVFTVIVGTSIFTTLASSQEQRILFVVGVISVITAVLSGVNASLNYPQAAEKHLNAGRKYGGLRRRAEELLCSSKSDAELEPLLDQIRDEWSKLEAESPDVTQRFIDEARDVITKKPVKKWWQFWKRDCNDASEVTIKHP